MAASSTDMNSTDVSQLCNNRKGDGLLNRANGLLDKANGLLDKKSRATCSRDSEESQLLL